MNAYRTKEARKFLEKYKRLDSAIDQYYSDPNQFGGGASSKRAEADRTAKLNALFDKYKGSQFDKLYLDTSLH